MRKGRRSYDESTRQRLLDLWRGQDDFGEPIGCVATSYTFQADFFEEQCLGRFLRMDTESAEDGRAYLLEHETKLSQAFACVFVDHGQVAGSRSLRWHLLPVRVRGAIQHAKISLLQWESCVRILVGSANLTVPGYRSNFEHMASLDLRPEGGPPLSILRDVVGCLRALQQRSPGTEQGAGPQKALGEFLSGVVERTRGWTEDDSHRGKPKCSFVWIGPGRPSLFASMAKLWSGPPATFARILSPFFSDGRDARTTTDELERELLISRGECAIQFVCPGHRAPDGAIELQVPEALRKPSRAYVEHGFSFVAELQGGEEQERRHLHAKSLWVQRDGRVLLAVGSSNFTVNGTGVAKSPNVEANLVYEIPDATDTFGKMCAAASPPMEDVDLDAQEVRFLHDPDDQVETSDGCEYAPLPDAFGAALFDPRDSGGALHLELIDPPPRGFSVSGAGKILLDGANLGDTNFPRVVTLHWPQPRPPSVLEVAWSEKGETLRAVWVVNVTNAAALPPPDELRQLNLEELLQVLTSARPYHEAVARVIRAREATGKPAPAPIVDPHRKVDTSNYLLRRMKRLSAALEGLRERMQRPVFSHDALMWRLRGPLGPLALAQRLAQEEGEAAGFMIAEVATTLADAPPTFGAEVAKDEADREIRAVLDELVKLARQHPAPANLASYVDNACKEILS